MDNVEKTELTAAEKLAQMEKEKLTRRQALARFGFQAGAAAVAALTADDLLRAVGKEMQQRAGNNKIAQQVATEFQNAGVAHAVTAARTHPWEWPVPVSGNCDADVVEHWCGYYFCYPEESQYPNDPLAACNQCCFGVYDSGNCQSTPDRDAKITLCKDLCKNISVGPNGKTPCAASHKPITTVEA